MKMCAPAESSLLSIEQNHILIGLLDDPQRCKIRSISVVQLYATREPSHHQWHKQQVGVLCFIKDNIRHGYFFELFSLQQSCKVWEHELNAHIEYIDSTRFFHEFKGKGAIFAFHFADDSEANRMKTIVLKIVKRLQLIDEMTYKQAPSIPQLQIQAIITPPPAEIKKQKITEKHKLTKEEISSPTGFEHRAHVSVNNTFFKDGNVKQLFQAAAMEKNLEDQQTRDLLYTYINDQEHKETLFKQVAPPSPTHNLAEGSPTDNLAQPPSPSAPKKLLAKENISAPSISQLQSQAIITPPLAEITKRKITEKQKLTKEDISSPTEFKHLAHVSVNNTFFKDDNVKQHFQAPILEKNLEDYQ